MVKGASNKSSVDLDYKEIFQDPLLKRNLLACIVVWSMCTFNNYILTFFIRYFPGNIFENSLCFALSDVFAFMLSGLVLKYTKVVRGYRLAFLISILGAVLYALFASIPSMLPVFVTLSRIGVTMSFNLGYVSVPKLFPIKVQSTVYAVVNLFAHIIACLAPIIAELPAPIPHISYLSAIGIALGACS